MKKTKKILRKIIAFAGIMAFMGQPMLVFATDPITAADMVGAPLITPSKNSAEGNAALLKQKTPQIQVIFDKSSVSSGETVTAFAMTTGFVKDDKQLYYTWYLKHKNNKMDNDEKINEAKIEAAKIIVRGNFEKQDSNYSGTNISNKGFEAQPKWNGDKDELNCYLQNSETGRIYELSSSEDSCTCPNGGVPACASTKNISCSYANPLNQVVPPPSPLATPDPILQTKKACIEAVESNPKITTTDVQNFQTSATCTDGSTPKCLSGNSGKEYFNNGSSDADTCSALGLYFNGTTWPSADARDSTCEKIDTGVPSCTRVQKGNSCEHLFAKPPRSIGRTGDGKYTMDEEKFWGTNPNVKSTAGNENQDEANIVGLGVNSFTWTYHEGDQIGVVVEGEANIATKHDDASNMITWAFSQNACTAFNDKTKDPKDSGQYYTKEGTTGTPGAVGFLSVENFDINDCLKDNLIDPATGGQGNLSVSLQYDPQNPVNVPAGSDGTSKGDVVNMTAVVANVVSASDFSYKWSIEKSEDGTDNPGDYGWTDMTNEFNDKTVTEGIGKNTFSFKLNLANNKFRGNFIRVRVEVTESTNNGEGRKTKASAVIKVGKPDRDVETYGVTVSGGKLLLDKNVPICKDQDPCSVVKNEIVGIMLPNNDNKFKQFDWKYDGETLGCDKKISDQCSDGNATNMAFFPVTGQEGNSFTVSATAKMADGSTSQEFSKTFNVMAPAISIYSTDENAVWPKNMGYIKTLNGDVEPSISDNVFEGITGSDVSLEARFYPEFLNNENQAGNNIQTKWFINGSESTQFANKKKINFKSELPAGDVYNISVSSAYAQPEEIRQALSNLWGISAFESRATQAEKEIQIMMLQSEYEGLSMANPAKNFFANLVSNLPGQTMFLLRISLTMVLMLLVTGIVFSLMPGAAAERKEL